MGGTKKLQQCMVEPTKNLNHLWVIFVIKQSEGLTKLQDHVLPVYQVTISWSYNTTYDLTANSKLECSGYSLPGRIHQCHNCLDDPNASFNPPG